MMKLPQLDYSQTPFLIIWETTQACDLACQHCRASAQPLHHPDELTTAEGENLLRQASNMGVPIFVLSGGDPLKRPDLFHLLRFGADLGMRMATIPAATPMLTEDVVKRLKDSGCSQMAVSLDFPTAQLHDTFRGVPGAYDLSLRAIDWAHKHQMPVQINTTLCGESAAHLPDMIELVKKLDIVFWEVFFLVPIGRGTTLQGLSAAQCEEIFELLYRVQKEQRFVVKITEAPHFRRYVVQREMANAARAASQSGHPRTGHPTTPMPGIHLPPQLIRTEGPGHTIGRAPQGVNSGKGFLFISHTGEIFPSGFLPFKAGHIRHDDLATVYRENEIFKQLRQPSLFGGVCGICEFNEICGGSRSRAYALTGDYLASDPWCVYKPQTSHVPA